MKFAIAILAAFWVAATAFAAQASQLSPAAMDFAQRCLKQGAVADYLMRAWSEEPVSSDELGNGYRTLLFKSRRGSWTLVEYRPNGNACIQASGLRLGSDTAADDTRPAG